MIPHLLYSQLRSMFIKDQLIRKRHYIVTLFELFVPIVLVLLQVTQAPNESRSKINSRTLRSINYNDGDYDTTSFSCFSFIDSLFYTSPVPTGSLFRKPDQSTCGVYATPFDTPIEVIKAWGIKYNPSMYTKTAGLFFDYLDLDKGIANMTVSISSIGYIGSSAYNNILSSSLQNYNFVQSVVGLLIANHPHEQNMTYKDFQQFFTTKLFNEGNPLNHSLKNRETRGNRETKMVSSPVDTFSIYASYVCLELGFIYVSLLITSRIVREKMTNSKELLRIMGLTDLVYWLSHFVNYFLLSIFHGTIITIIYSIFTAKSPFHGWNPSLFWFNYMLNSVTSILFTFVFTTILTRPVIGLLLVIVGRSGLAYLPSAASSMSGFFLLSPKTWSCLLPSGQVFYSIYDLIVFGNLSDKAKWSNIFTSIDADDTIALWSVYLTTIVSWCLYAILIWYIDAVWPWQPGTPKPWHFPFSQYCAKSPNDIELASAPLTIDRNDYKSGHINHEFESGNLKSDIKCTNVVKSFDSMGHFAVNNLNVKIFKGQITVLLGQNGAGKTTLMSMITGILKPSSGNILVNGIDVHRDLLAARRCLALCPQHELLFEELTVRENLELCAGLRGLSDHIKRTLIPLNIKRVNLTEKENITANNLSGGMRRRLQLALALSTASDILILDEPTSGLDPESRRQIWDLLLELRKDLTILLTTHFMEEADTLGDRIIIMGSGQIKCSGSPMFLKRRFATGFSIRCAKDQRIQKSSELTARIQSYFSNAELLSETKEEIIYQLEKDSSNNENSSLSLANLCDELDNNLTHFGIASYGISMTTLEDVFLKVTQEEDDDQEKTVISMENKMFEMAKILDYNKLSGISLTLQQFRGLFMKRFHYTKRHFKTIAFSIILPAIVTIFTFFAARSTVSTVQSGFSAKDYSEPIPLDLKTIYGSNAKAVIRASFSKNLSFIDSYRKIMKESGIEVVEISSYLSMNEYCVKSKQSRQQFMDENIIGLIEDETHPKGFAGWYNPKAALSLPLSLNAWQNAFIRSEGERAKSKMTVTYKSMPNRYKHDPGIIASVGQIMVALFSSVGFSLIAVSYYLFPINESQNKSNFIQKMTGIKAPVFWLSSYVFDIIYHLIVTTIILLSILIVDRFLLTSVEVLASVVILLILCGIASIPLFYTLSLLPLTPDRGFSLFSTVSIVGTAIGSGIATSLMAFANIKSLHVILGDLFPPFAVSFGLSKIYRVAVLQSDCNAINACPNGNSVEMSSCCDEHGQYKRFPLFTSKESGILVEIFMLLFDSILYTTALIILDLNFYRLGYWFERIRNRSSSHSQVVNENNPEDEDVSEERTRIKGLTGRPNGVQTETLIVKGLSKHFGSFKAVDGIYFGVKKGECFGLLGVNGAGKTTTFRMLTGDLQLTHGDAYVCGRSLSADRYNYQKLISYCPQFDALIDKLTPVETLMLFARIRGMPEAKVKSNVLYIIGSLDLTGFSNTCNQYLSGGNKRKLSLAIAAIASPEVIFLDEPTTGVDPASRRKIWSTLMHLREANGSSIILSSHSMDECETLCSRIGIMANGKFKCFGSSQHLKQKFGLGFTLTIKMVAQQQQETTLETSNSQNDNYKEINQNVAFNKINQFICYNFPSSVLREVHQLMVEYHIKDTSLRYGSMLRCLNDGKRILPIEDFTLTGTSLEQIFLSFAKRN